MKLKGLLKEIKEILDQYDHCDLIALVHDSDLASDGGFNFREFPIVDIHADHDDSEINLIFEKGKGVKGLSADEFVNRVSSLPHKCGKYQLFTGYNAPEEIEGYSFRLDIPIIGIIRHKEKPILGLLQWFEGFEKELGLTK